MSDTMTLRPYLLTDDEAQTVRALVGAAIELLVPTASDDELIAALQLRDRFKPEETP